MTTTDLEPYACTCGRAFRSALGLKRHATYQGHREASASGPVDATAEAVEAVTSGLAALDRAIVGATAEWLEGLDHQPLVETVDWLQQTRATLGRLEAYVVRELGRDDTRPTDFTLADGRTAELLKSRDRKEWRHGDWQRDVRQRITDGILGTLTMVDPDTGEAHDENAAAVLEDVVAKAQAVHGSTPPKSTALKALGLAADDYCTSYPGPWALKITAPATPTTTERNA